MNLIAQKKLASDILKCGINRVWIDPDLIDDVEGAITRADIRTLIKRGVIKAKKKIGQSTGRKKKIKKQKMKGRRRGIGSREGAKNARTSRKRKWMQKVRAQRRLLKEMRDNGNIDRHIYRKLYRQVSGGMFRSKEHLKMHIETIISKK